MHDDSRITTVEHQSIETPLMQGDARTIDSALKGLWEKARRAGELLAQIKDENRDLRTQAEELRRQLQQIQQELARKDQMIHQLSAELAGAQSESKRAVLFANGERELLATRVKDLLAKIESYL